MNDLNEEERELAAKEEAEVERKRKDAIKAAAERGLADAQRKASAENDSSKQTTQMELHESDETTQDPLSKSSSTIDPPSAADG